MLPRENKPNEFNSYLQLRALKDISRDLVVTGPGQVIEHMQRIQYGISSSNYYPVKFQEIYMFLAFKRSESVSAVIKHFDIYRIT